MPNEVKGQQRLSELGYMTRALPVAPETINAEKRTVEAVFTTEQPARVIDWERGEVVDEVLLVEGMKFESKIPFLDSHNRFSVKDQLGSGRNIRKESGKLVGELHFGSKREAQEAFEMVRDGHITDVSIGYRTKGVFIEAGSKYTHTDGRVFEGPLKLGLETSIKEISLTPIGADSLAKVRSENQVILKNEEKPVAGDETADTKTSNKEGQKMSDSEKTAAPATATRAEQIAELASVAGMSEKAGEWITGGKTVEAIRAEIIEAQKSRNQVIASNKIHVNADEADKFRKGMSGALLRRADVRGAYLDDFGGEKAIEASGLVPMKLSDIARECLERDGQSMRNKPLEEIAKRALGLSTGDFTNILANVSNKSMAKGYTEAGTTYQRWCGMMALSDFKTATIAKLSSVGDVSEVGEGQPFKQVKSVDDKESVTLKTYGSNFVISRQAIVNDDLGALSRTPAALAQSIRRKINSLAYGVLTANAAMNDGVTLFHSTHKNVGSTAAISNTTVTEAVKLMGLQTDPNGSRLNLRPKYLLVCKNKESIALQQLNANVPITYVSAASVDVYRGQVEIISDAVLDGTNTSATMYYFAADQNIIDTVTIFNLNGIDAPTFEMAESSGAEPLGVTYRIYMDVTAAAIDHRGLVYNAGA